MNDDTIFTVVSGSNADLIRQVALLYARDNPKVADLTYGKGVFWRKTPHLRVFGSDIITCPKRPHDFRSLPYGDETFDIAVLDPPYVHSPGRHMTDARYQNAATTRGMLWKDIRSGLFIPGMREAMRIVKRDGGQIWVKCMDQVQSGMQRWCHAELLHDALGMGLVGRDLFVLVPQSTTSSNRWSVQHHARKRHSYLWVFQRPTGRQRGQMKREQLGDLAPFRPLVCHTDPGRSHHTDMTKTFAQTVIWAYYANNSKIMLYDLKLTHEAGKTLQDLATKILDRVQLSMFSSDPRHGSIYH